MGVKRSSSFCVAVDESPDQHGDWEESNYREGGDGEGIGEGAGEDAGEAEAEGAGEAEAEAETG